ncbi:MAG TPA: acetyl-coenzyme A synthetase N-terminal domain-containing protein, partial [Marinobacter sp.]|nr:acetyl-coenzyme A synthetase N-terminal domain-containing protein [Marinobacter sp.]
MSYNTEFRRSINQRDKFWREQAANIDWFTPPETIWQPLENGHGEWFPDGTLNTSDVALDANIRAGRGDQTALIYDSPVTQTQQSFTYHQLRDDVALFAGALREHGIGKGDRVIIYMPMIPQAVVAML